MAARTPTQIRHFAPVDARHISYRRRRLPGPYSGRPTRYLYFFLRTVLEVGQGVPVRFGRLGPP